MLAFKKYYKVLQKLKTIKVQINVISIIHLIFLKLLVYKKINSKKNCDNIHQHLYKVN